MADNDNTQTDNSDAKGTMYQVVGECAFLTIKGNPRQLLLKGAVFSGDDVPKAELDHNVEGGLVGKVGDDPSGVNADGGLGAAKPADDTSDVDTKPDTKSTDAGATDQQQDSADKATESARTRRTAQR